MMNLETKEQLILAKAIDAFQRTTGLHAYMRFKRPQDQYSTPIDLIPFGGVENLDSTIEWPPEMNVVMNVSGFSEALRSAILLKIAENFSIRVASLAGMAALKLIAWQDRGPRKPR